MSKSSSKVRTPAQPARAETARDPSPSSTWTAEAIARERRRLQIPDEPVPRRNWVRYQLLLKGWNQKRLAEVVNASESSISVIYLGQRTVGEKADRVRTTTAEILGIPEPVLFPEAHARKAS